MICVQPSKEDIWMKVINFILNGIPGRVVADAEEALSKIKVTYGTA
jgi:hypothetical protein